MMLGKYVDYTSQIPELFLSDDFDLTKQAWFEKVLQEDASITQERVCNNSNQDNMLLQLIQLLDMLETTLYRKTSQYAGQANDILTQYRSFNDEWATSLLIAKLAR